MSDRVGTVLFADVSGSTRLYETAGDSAALEAISRCLAAAAAATEASGGRVIKTIGDEVMSIFPEPDAAASAAADMQTRIDTLPEVAGTKLGVRIGFHQDRKSTRLNSSHLGISYAVFCLKKKNKDHHHKTNEN